MNVQGQRDLLLLSEVERDAGVTQRSLSTKLGVALGLTNLYLKRLARKGYIKVTTIPHSRIRYLLTPQGFTEKSRLTYLYMQYSLLQYRDMRTRLKEMMSTFDQYSWPTGCDLWDDRVGRIGVSVASRNEYRLCGIHR